MILKSLRLSQFRNWNAFGFDVEPGLTLIVGPNGTGKTNLLEAVTLLACGASLRGAETDHMIRWGQRQAQIRAIFGGREGTLDVQMKLKTGRPREIRLDGGAAVRLKDLVGRVPLVTFVPDDLYFVKGEPEARRRGLNMLLCQVDRTYMERLRAYQEALKQRNATLRLMAREGRDEDESLPAWDEALLEHGTVLMEARARAVLGISPRVQAHYEELASEPESVEIRYRPSVEVPEGEEAASFWRQRLGAARRQELALGSTVLGPHRDDLEVLRGGHPARAFSSQGEQRTIALAFKFAQAAYLESAAGEPPLFLLDDVLSELDETRRGRLVEFISRGGQCLVTLTSLEGWAGEAPPRVVHLSAKSGEPAAALS